jgi:hypothetical protein
MANLEELLLENHKSVKYEKAKECEDSPAGVEHCAFCLGDQYFDNNQVNYSCKDKRTVYVLRYLPVHLQEVKQCLDGLRGSDELPLNWPDPVRVLSIGGGPGSDIAGFKKFISDAGFYDENHRNFEILRLEKVEDWNDHASKIVRLYTPEDYEFDYRRKIDDINNLPGCVKGPFDIFLLSYVVSELTELECIELGKAIDTLFNERAVVVINDRSQEEVLEKTRLILQAFNVLDRFSCTTESWCGLHYPDELVGITAPKLNMKSRRYSAVVAHDY